MFEIKKQKKAIDKIVHKISEKLPLRLKMDVAGKSDNTEKRNKYFEKIRETFMKHKPQIEITKYIGTGGFADVLEATSNYDGITDFAIKILRSDLLKVRKGQKYNQDEEEMRVKDVKKRFKNESYVQWSLSQSLSDNVADSVVKVYDHGEFDSENEFRFLLMERMGSTLRDFMKNEDSSNNDRDLLIFKVFLMTKLADIIKNVHGEGIFHRDIKPENILFPIDKTDSDTEVMYDPKAFLQSISVKLGDFGTVRWVKTLDNKYDGVIIGSQFYMSPEQIFHPKSIDARTDIYSFGIVCYELLYGIHPKNVTIHTSNVLEKLAREKPEPRIPPKGFEGLHDIIFRCLANQHDRYQTMDEVYRQIKAFAFGLKIM